MELPGKRKRGRSKTRFMDAVREDMPEVEVNEEDTEGWNNWIWKIRCGDPRWETPKEEEVYVNYLLFNISKYVCLLNMDF